MAELDCLCSHAFLAKRYGLSKPEMEDVESDDSEPLLDIKGLKHPCVEATVKQYIPNDVKMGGDTAHSLLITGPNMGGKSTIL